MDFLKKNIGLIIYTVVCLALSGLIITGIRRAATTASESKKKVARQSEFFERIKSNEYAINRANREAAGDNQTMVEAKFHDLRQWLAQNYSIAMDPPPTSVECVTILQEEIRRMKKDTEDKEIAVGAQCQFFSFDSQATSSVLPPVEDIPLILRQIKVVKEVVRIVGLSLAGTKPAELTSIHRALGLKTQEADLYTITPVDITIVAPMLQIQDLINRFHKESQYLFFLRNITLVSRDQAPNGVAVGFDSVFGARATTPAAGGAPGPMEMGMGGPPEMFGMPGAGGPPGAVPPRGGRPGARTPAPAAPTSAAPAVAGPDLAALTKNELVIFGDVVYQADLRLDLVEFREPKKATP
ncbi:MAG: hypothetical protein A3K19_12805 [Lentisphaerae bacterium RIFOXYB12_FULL_65_16]|nr:MAG: hypothetical protein A3K18_13600 [Lentisphaerae bacterium RIFOXYA12_64_32]OGV87193.1 MAG: hypothetical protein A3K19_12805 [Lentisphaerae bacterium RIFOXYB12_FULL_65_16]